MIFPSIAPDAEISPFNKLFPKVPQTHVRILKAPGRLKILLIIPGIFPPEMVLLPSFQYRNLSPEAAGRPQQRADLPAETHRDIYKFPHFRVKRIFRVFYLP